MQHDDARSDGLSLAGHQIESLVQRYQEGVWRYLRSLGCSHQLAEDLTQETFLAVLQKPFEYISPSATACYLRRVAYHLLVEDRRRRGRESVSAQIEQLDSAWTRWIGYSDGSSALDALEHCFQALSSRAQLALRLRFRDGASRQRIAGALGISENGTKNLMQRAKSQLRECIAGKLE
jgi:RNA polymerase sigma-70 factor (ECF subfamily)